MAGRTDDGSASVHPATRGRPARGSALPVGLSLLAGAVAAAVALPLAWLFVTTLDVDPAAAFELLTRPRTLRVFANSAVMVALVTGLSVVVAVPLAFLTERTTLPYGRFWTIVVSLPLVIPSYIGAFAFVSAFGPHGELQSLLAPLGVESLPTVYGLGGTVVVLTIYTYPYVYLSTRAALKTMDASLVEAARTLGHSRWRTFRRVTVQQVKPAVAAGSLLVALYALSDFGTPAIMRFDVFTRVIYVNRFELDYSALLSVQLVAVTLFILALESRVRGHEQVSGGSARGYRIDLGRWRWPAAALPACVALFGLALPVGILCLWLVRGGPTGDSAGFTVEYVANSVAVAAAAALVAGLACLPVAYLAAYHRGRLSTLFERTTYLGYAVPGVVLGLSVVFFGARYLPAVYQTLPLLVFAYVVRFIPQAVGSTRAAFLRTDPALPEAARTLGRRPLSAFREVTLPLVAPGLLAGVALVFLTTMKELPMTLLLRPTGFDTLVTRIWRAESAGYFGEAAVPAFVLLFVSALSLVVVLGREGYDVE